MARPKQSLFIPVGAGESDAVDEKLLPRGKMLSIKGAEYQTNGRLQKRRGFTSLSTTAGDSSTLGAGNSCWQLGKYREQLAWINRTGSRDPLLLFNAGADQWARSDHANHWPIQSATRARVTHSRRTLYTDQNESSNLPVMTTTAYLSGVIAVCMHVAGTGNYRLLTMDAVSGAMLLHTTESGDNPKVVASDGYFVVFYERAGSLRCVRYAPTTASAGATEYTVGTLTGHLYYDAQTDSTGDLVNVAFYDSGGPTINLVSWDPSANAAANSSTISDSVDGAIAWLDDYGSAGVAALAYIDTSAGLLVHYRNETTMAAVSNWTVDATSDVTGGLVNSLAGYTTGSDSSGEFAIFYTIDSDDLAISDAARYDHRIKMCRRASSTNNLSTFARSVSLASRVIETANGEHFFLVSYDSTTQPCYFLMWDTMNGTAADTVTMAPEARIFPGQGYIYEGAAGEDRLWVATPVQTGVTDEFAVALLRTPRIESSGSRAETSEGNPTFYRTVDLVKMQFDPELPPPAEAAGSILTMGSQMRMFDGRSYVEYGFPVNPEPIVNLTTSGSSSGIGEGTYNFLYVYAWIDANGLKHRSWTSAVAQKEITTADSISLQIPTLRITSLIEQLFSSVTIEVYRSTNAGTTYYLDGAVDNDETADRVQYTSSATDAEIVEGEILYTQGAGGADTGALENEPPPPCSAAAVYRNHIAIINAENPNEIWFSKSLQLSNAPGFSDSLVLSLSNGVEAVALAVTDDRLFILTRNDGIHMFIGDPPDDTGAGTMPTTQQICQVNCDNPRSVLVQDGVWFQGMDGRIRHLNRGLSLDQIPADVGPSVADDQDADRRRVTCAVYLQGAGVVRFFGYAKSDNTKLMSLEYNVNLQRWCTGPEFTISSNDYVPLSAVPYAGTSATDPYEGMATTLWSSVGGFDDRVRVEDYDGTLPTMEVQFPWIAPAGPMAEVNLHSLQILGENIANHTLTITIGYDYVDGAEAHTYTTTATGPDGLAIKIRPNRHRCTAFQVTISDTSGGAQARRFSLSGITAVFSLRGKHQRNALPSTAP